jgi:ribosomal protein S18 acetylase RimI-like enzyme
LIYDGADLIRLREPVGIRLEEYYQRAFNPEAETQAGEMYIDCLAVSPNNQGNGVGTTLLRYIVAYYHQQQNKTLGLLVDKENPRAKRLYESLGFKVVGEKPLVGKLLEHLQLPAR